MASHATWRSSNHNNNNNNNNTNNNNNNNNKGTSVVLRAVFCPQAVSPRTDF